MSNLTINEIGYAPGITRFAPLAGSAGAVFLDGGDGHFADSRYDIVTAWPETTITVEAAATPTAELFESIEAMAAPQPDGDHRLPFCGGLIGYLGYDLNRAVEAVPGAGKPRSLLPQAWVGRYSWALVQDHLERRAWLVARNAAGRDRVARFRALLDSAPIPPPPFRLNAPLTANMSRGQYRDAVARIIEHIHAGDCYQVNFAQCFRASYSGDPWTLYQSLRRRLPAPYGAYIDTGSGCLLCASPERFLEVDGRTVRTSPIKGTRPRRHDAAEDAAEAAALAESAKDRAENLMIVDLLRNDLGRSCIPGSIAVDALFELHSYANVHHLVSSIHGELQPGISELTALKLAFPGGSITGAPKVKAMEIIAELEPEPRSAYCGSVFYRSDDGRLDSNIAIRSIVADGISAACWGGGGIVADSDPEAEYAETLAKIEPLLAAMRDGA